MLDHVTRGGKRSDDNNLEIVKKLENPNRIMKVIMDNINQIPVVENVVEKGPGLGALRVTFGPLVSESEGLLFPGQERNLLDNGGLNNFLTRVNTPGDGVGSTGGVCLEVSSLVDGVKSDFGLVLQLLN